FFGGSIVVLNSTTLKTLARIPAGTFPDGSAYVPAVKRLFVSDEAGRTETVINTVTNRRIATLPLGGEAGMTAYDPVTGHVLVNVQTLDELLAIDPVTKQIVARYSLPATCHHNHGLLLDVPSRLAFIACDHNARLLVMNLNHMQVTAVHRVGRDPDVLAIDLKRQRLYVASESGVVSVFHITKDGLRKLGQGYVGDDAHSVAVDPSTGLIYLPIEDFHGKPVLKIMRYQITGTADGRQ
ncbi:MAG: YncE family protein, partial [Gammaproteobacteria bacterium]|nr:YncE family protein [Gammaproteobacteria bacterium]